MTADETQPYVSRLESRHEDLLIHLLARAAKARMQLRLLRHNVDERCRCEDKAVLLERIHALEQHHAQTLRKLEGDLLLG